MREYSGYVLVVEDDVLMSGALQDQLDSWNYEVTSTESAVEALHLISQRMPDLIISDIHLKGEETGLWLCEQVRLQYKNEYIPIILMTGSLTERLSGLRAGADDFLSKPFNLEELALRSESLLRIRGQLGRLKRFFAPQIADLIVSDDGAPLTSHRREVTVIFVDLRGFTAFSEKSEPNEVMRVLNEYYSEIGRLTVQYRGTLGHIAGDGMMIFFNDPVQIDHHQTHAFKMILEMRRVLNDLAQIWRERGHHLSYGIGVSSGEATVGAIGFREFWEYSVIGAVPNLAFRLCSHAKAAEVLMCENFTTAIGALTSCQPMNVCLHGISEHTKIFSLQYR